MNYLGLLASSLFSGDLFLFALFIIIALIIFIVVLSKKLTRTTNDLEQSEFRLSEVEKLASTGYYEYYVKTDELKWSDSMYKLFGIEKSEQVPTIKQYFDSVHEDDREVLQSAFNNAINNSTPFECGYRTTLGGNEKSLITTCSVTKDKDGNIEKVLGVVREVTDERKVLNELKENEERFRKLSDLTFEGVLIHDDGVMLDCNQSFLRIVGYEREELIGKNVIKIIIVPDDVRTVAEKVKNNDTRPYEVKAKRKNGEIFPVEIESHDIVLDGESVRVAAIRDVTKQYKQKELIKKEQWLFKTLMNNLPDSIYFKDLQSKFIRVNNHIISKFNFKSDSDLLGKSDFDFFDEEHARPAFEDEQEIIRSKIPIVNKIEKESWKDGTFGWGSTTKLPLIDMDGNVVGTFGITRDITDLKYAQDNLIAQKEKFEQLIRLVPSAVFTVNLEKKFTSWNEMAEKLTGFSSQDILGKDCTFYGLNQCPLQCRLFDTDVDKPIVNAECKMRRKDGSIITISKNIDFIRDAEGNITGGIESFIDISEQKKFEDKIKKYSDELSELNKSKDRFFSIIAHDLRNPFVTLLGFSEMLIEDYYEFSDDEKIGYLKEMENTARSSYNLLENLLQWSRSQTGRLKYSPQELNFVDLVKENFELLEKSAEMKKIKLESKLSQALFVNADYDMLTTLIRNLITNALKFTPEGGAISIGSREIENRFIEFYIKDTGVGISSKRLKGIFRIDEASSTTGTAGEKGSGLGLLLSKEFVDKHGGKIWVESQEGKGTTFFFTLPKA